MHSQYLLTYYSEDHIWFLWLGFVYLERYQRLSISNLHMPKERKRPNVSDNGVFGLGVTFGGMAWILIYEQIDPFQR